MITELTGTDSDTDRFATWDGPYVLGALTLDERREFEAHMTECAACRTAVADLAGLPGLLARVSVSDLPADDYPDEGEIPPIPEYLLQPPDEMVNRVVDATRRFDRRRRLRQFAVGAGVALVSAAAAVAVAFPFVHKTTTSTTGPQVVAAGTMRPLTTTPITAKFTLLNEGNSTTRVEMTCHYAPNPSGAPAYIGVYSMWITMTDGNQENLATWPVQTGQTVHVDPIANVPANQIHSVDIRSETRTLLNGTI